MSAKNILIHHTLLFLQSMLNFQSPLRILEVGCGDGSFAKVLTAAYPHIYLLAIDIDKIAIEEAKKIILMPENVIFWNSRVIL